MALKKTFRQVTVTATKVLVAAGNFNLVGWNLINQDATAAYLKLYNAAAIGDVTLGTTTPVKTLFIPDSGTSLLSVDGESLQDGFSLGIVIAVVTGILDSSTTAPSTGAYVELKYQANQ